MMTGSHCQAELCLDGRQTLTDAVRASTVMLDGLDLADGDRHRLAILIEELLANLFDHGTGDVIALLRLERTSDRVHLTLEDEGAPFDPREAGPAEPNEERGGGVGLALVRAWPETLSYWPGPPSNRLDLSLRLANR